MKKEMGLPVAIGVAVVALIAIVGYGWYMLNPPVALRDRVTSPPEMGGKQGAKAMPTAPNTGDFSK